MFHTIVAATDGSSTALMTEQLASALAASTEAQLMVASAHQGDPESRSRAERAAEEGQRRAEAAGVNAMRMVVEGEAAAALVELADHADAELLVVGDVGMGSGKRMRLGGVPDRISHSAPCSVLIVRSSANPGQRSTARYGSIAIATDGSATANHACQVGVELADALDASITLLYAGDELMGTIVLRDAAERLGRPELSQRILTGDPGRAIARAAGSEGCDLVVVGNRGIAGARRVLGSVPNTVSHEATCDVLIVHTVGRSLSDLRPGEGAIVEDGSRKLAGYRDLSGKLIALSRKCTHLGCGVQWNATAQTWDCPCHGSRYDSAGKVIKGPAQRDLEPVTL
ncbi:MAG TPA: universal stress protein [Solirubrobacteraceae bacterium]|nr:universal stress protein [Solirubrobacteraceae bacterium]